MKSSIKCNTNILPWFKERDSKTEKNPFLSDCKEKGAAEDEMVR